jgi:hypothetical protein
VPYLRRLLARFPPRRPGFEPGSSCMGFVVDSGTGAGFLHCGLINVDVSRVAFSLFFLVRVPPDVFPLELCPPRVFGV